MIEELSIEIQTKGKLNTLNYGFFLFSFSHFEMEMGGGG